MRATHTAIPAVSSPGTTIVINITDALETLTVSDSNEADNTIAEDVAVDTAVSGVSLIVVDEVNRNVSDVSWSLSNDAGGVFEIGTASGVLSLAQATLDYEDTTEYEVSAVATSGDVTSPPFILTITVTNVLDTLIISDNNGADNTILETAPPDTAVSGISLAVIDE